jgi:threonine dehydrogenase-like Zn-dependent dehydrogenase
VDISPWRVGRVKKFADHIVACDGAKAHKPIAEITNGRMADVVIEASGDSAVVNSLCCLIREGGWDRDDDGGRIHLQGDYPDPISITQYSQWFNRNLRMSTSCAFKPGDKEAILSLIKEGKFDARILWDKEIPVDDVPGEYPELEEHHETRIKTLIKW